MQARQLAAAFVGMSVFVLVLVLSFIQFGTNSNEEEFHSEFSASGKITGSTLLETPANFGDGTFAVYFKRTSEDGIVLELSANALGDDGSTYSLSVKDGKMSLWTTGSVVSDSVYDALDAINGFKMYDCDDTVVNEQSWSEEYAITKEGNQVTIDLGENGGKVYFTLSNAGMPTSVQWGGLTGSIETFATDNSFKGTLGKDVPVEFPCQKVLEDLGEDASGIPDVSADEAEALIGDLNRRLASEMTEAEYRRLESSSATDLAMAQMSIAAYNNKDCGAPGWYPWFSIHKANAYAQVCWKPGNECTIAFRGSDDFSDWWSNTAGNLGSKNWGGMTTPKGFWDEYTKITSSNSFGSWNWARTSVNCNKIHVTGHSLGGAMAAMLAQDQGYASGLVTFGAPKVSANGAGAGVGCGGRRYYLTSDWGDDPVPGLPPWGNHIGTGKKLVAEIYWFSRRYRLDDQGCGGSGGGGFNPFQHSSYQYLDYIQKTM
jgi:hypothetical protein